MATIQARIEGRVGEVVGGDTGFTAIMLQDAYDHGLRTVVMAMPEGAWKYFGKNEIDFLPLAGTPLLTDKIISVLRLDGSIYRKCVEIDYEMAGPAADLNSIHYATAFTPAYLIDSGTFSNPMLKVLPDASSKVAKLVCVAIPVVDITTDTIVPHFPDELEELPELYTAIWVKQREMGLARRNSQTEIRAVISILGSVSPVSNSVNALLVAAAATDPADQDALQHLSDDLLDHAKVATGLGQARIQEAATTVQAAQSYAGQSSAASNEAKQLQTEFDKKLGMFIARFQKEPKTVFADRRRA